MKASEILRAAADLPLNEGGRLVSEDKKGNQSFCMVGAIRSSGGCLRWDPSHPSHELIQSALKTVRDLVGAESLTSWFDGHGAFVETAPENRRNTPAKLQEAAAQLEAKGL